MGDLILSYVKDRVVYIFVFLTVIILGISSRAYVDVLPVVVSSHLGDALWASMVYFGCRIVFFRQRLLLSACLSLLFSYMIEFSQLYQADWIHRVRSTILGGLILGKGFLAIDLVRYMVGILCSYVIDRYLFKRMNNLISKEERG
jgi:hypothetical protein